MVLFNHTFPHYNVPGMGGAPLIRLDDPGFPCPASSSGTVPEHGDKADMAKNCGKLSTLGRAPERCLRVRRPPGKYPVAAASLALVVLALNSACFFRKHKVEVPQARSPIRIALLPANVPTDNGDLQWIATATPLLMAQATDDSRDLDIVPLWESIPITKETLGDSRTITEENAAYIASRLTARWATLCTISPDKAGVALVLDFIPSKATLVPFRYEKKGPTSELNTYFREAFNQFLRYLVAEPLKERKLPDTASLRPVAEAVNREYGWSVAAEPGKSEAIVTGFARANQGVAALIFNPNLYPGIGAKPAAKPAPQAAPAPASAPPGPAAAPASAQPPGTASAPASPVPALQSAAAAQPVVEPDEDVVVPPPRTFTQEIGSLPQAAPDPPVEFTATGGGRASKEAAPAANTASPPPIAGDYELQVFATKGKARAEDMSEKLRKLGLTPRVETAEMQDKGTWFRIRLCGFKSRKAAMAAGDKLVADGLIEQYWIARSTTPPPAPKQ